MTPQAHQKTTTFPHHSHSHAPHQVSPSLPRFGDIFGDFTLDPTEDYLSSLLFEAGKVMDDLVEDRAPFTTGVVPSSTSGMLPTSTSMDLEPTPIGPRGIHVILPPRSSLASSGGTTTTTARPTFVSAWQGPAVQTMNPEAVASAAGAAAAAVQNMHSIDALRSFVSSSASTTTTPSSACGSIVGWDENAVGRKRSDSAIFSLRLFGDLDFPPSTVQSPSTKETTTPNLLRTVSERSVDTSKPATSPSRGHKDVEENEDDNSEESKERFRCYQNCQWNEKFNELVVFRKKHGHCLVPHNHQDQSLAQWVKRQRYQYKLRIQGKHSTINNERKARLDNLGFIFDSHSATWEEKFLSLLDFKESNGHCNVPSKHTDKNLAIWVKCQRRQMKLRKEGKQSAMTPQRIERLLSVGFVFNPRNL